MAREQADQDNDSKNKLSKHYGIQYRILTIYMPRGLYLYAIEDLNRV